MPSGLKRFHGNGDDHFVTFSCYRCMPLLNNHAARETFETILEQTRQRHGFHVFGYIIMPEHVHLLISEPKLQKLEDTFRALKTQTSRKLKGETKRFWQVRYHDFNVLTHVKFIEKLRYLHRNPVAAGFVERPEDWPWSSYRHWLTGERGRVEIETHWTWSRREPDRLLHPFTPLIASELR